MGFRPHLAVVKLVRIGSRAGDDQQMPCVICDSLFAILYVARKNLYWKPMYINFLASKYIYSRLRNLAWWLM